MEPDDFVFPPRYLVIQYQLVDDTFMSFYAEAIHLEALEHAMENWCLERRDAVLVVRRLSGEAMHFPASRLISFAEQSLDSISRDFAINAQIRARELEVKRGIIGTDFDPERD